MKLISFIADKRKICKEMNKDEGVINMILCHIYEIEPSSLYLRYYQEINDNEIKKFEDYFSPYINSLYPIQYLLGYTYFYGLKIKVNPNVLIPRSETEELVDLILKDHKDNTNTLTICDIGTGSGAIALALKNKRFNDKVMGCDISLKALEVAKDNANNLNLKIDFFQSDLLDKLINDNKKVDVIVSNPPYISYDDNEVEELVKNHEPNLALFAKDDGLYCYKEILKKCQKVLNPKGKIYFEIGYKQKEQIFNIAKEYLSNINISCYKDIYQNDRIIKIEFND